MLSDLTQIYFKINDGVKSFPYMNFTMCDRDDQ